MDRNLWRVVLAMNTGVCAVIVLCASGCGERAQTHDAKTVAASGFSPQSLAPLAWYQASPTSVLASAGAVTQWQDSSGNGHHLVQSNPSVRPQYSATGWNGTLPGVTFDGVDDFLEYSVPNGRLLADLAGEDKPFSVLVTWEPLDLDADYDLVQWDNGGANGGNSLIELRTNTTGPDEAKYRHRRGDGISSLLNTGSVKFTLGRRTTAFVFDGTALTIYDGSATHMNASANDRGPLTLVRFRLGHGDNTPFNGRIAEVVITDYALTAAMYQSYRDYAQQQWGGVPVEVLAPIVTCVANDNGTYYAVFGYQNTSPSAMTIPHGASNQLSAGGTAPSLLPTLFQPGTHAQVVTAPLANGSRTWQLGGLAVVATTSSPSCGPLSGGEPLDDNDDPLKIVPPAPGIPAEAGGTYVEATSNGVPLAQVPVTTQFSPAPPEGEEPPTLKLTHGSRGDRSVEVVIVNRTSLDLFFNDGHAEGAITHQPPSIIRAGSYGTFETRDDGVHGTAGQLQYRVGPGTGRPLLAVNWFNPLFGSNSYGQSVSSTGFLVDRVGGENALATVFFILRPSNLAAATCPIGSMQWIVDNLKSMEPALGFGAQAPAGVFTPGKRSGLGLLAWGRTGCLAGNVIGTIKQRAWSTDGFYTIDVLLDEFNGAVLTGTNKAVRIEVDPVDPTDSDGENQAHQAIQDAGGLDSIGIGSRIMFSGSVRIDHGNFLEVHPSTPLVTAPSCSSPNPPVSCNPVFQNIFTVNATTLGVPQTTFMGRAEGRACFLITVDGSIESPSGTLDEGAVLATISETTGDWILTSSVGTASGSLRGQARCVAANNVSPEYKWAGGGPTTMENISGTRACYLTGVGGDWTGSGSHVFVDIISSPARLSGPLLPPNATGPHGTARCIDIAGTGSAPPFVVNPGPRVVMEPVIDGCFYTRITGPFGGPFGLFPGIVDMLAQAIGTDLRWSAGVGGWATGTEIVCDRLAP
jgi:hypothetical protein